MKKINFFDPSIIRKSKLIDESLNHMKKPYFPLPSVVEISNSGTCNRKCIFCPRSDPNFKDVKSFISRKDHRKIVKELSSLNYSGILYYSGFNEPLLHKEIYLHVLDARTYLPNAKIEIITNGDVLNAKRLIKLFENGLSTIIISAYDGEEDVIKFKKMMKEANLTKDQYIIRNRFLPPEDDFGITMSNRAGMMANAEHAIPALKKSLKAPCYYPSYHFFIDYTGEVLMCGHDWGKKNILGNIKNSKLIDIWTSKIAMMSREGLINGDRNFSPCNLCDVKGDLTGSAHANAWKKFYEKNKESSNSGSKL